MNKYLFHISSKWIYKTSLSATVTRECSFVEENVFFFFFFFFFYIVKTPRLVHIQSLMPRLHLLRSSYDLFVYDFPYDFFGIVGGYKLRRMCSHCLRSPLRRQTRTKPYRDLADIVRQPQGYRTIIVLSSRPPYTNRMMPVRRPCGGFKESIR